VKGPSVFLKKKIYIFIFYFIVIIDVPNMRVNHDYNNTSMNVDMGNLNKIFGFNMRAILILNWNVQK